MVMLMMVMALGPSVAGNKSWRQESIVADNMTWMKMRMWSDSRTCWMVCEMRVYARGG